MSELLRTGREARDQMARDLVKLSQQTTAGTGKKPITQAEAERRATESMNRVERRERDRRH